jgi:peptidoglycan hydrolase-like protein with peptidoglycan-binding domain
MKKLVLSAAVLAVLTGGMTTAVSFATMVPASACAATSTTSSKSENLARRLPQVNHGDKGKHVLALQLALRQEGYTYLKGTGTYAGETLRAVKDFQRKHHIKASGIVGSKTWQALVGKKPEGSTADHMHALAAFSLQPGERNQDKLNILTNMLSRIYPYVDQIDGYSGPSDVYGPELQKIVRDFQKRAGIKASGIVGPKTVSAMNEAISVAGQWGC